MSSAKEPVSTHRYHHGDLAESALREATAMIRDEGLEGLSLRKLATRVGVTPSALYHHFRDKNDLLCALAERGFEALETTVLLPSLLDEAHLETQLRSFVRAYIAFADQNPELYDLMFGRTIWKAGTPTPALRAVAFGSFRRYLERMGELASGMPNRDAESPLRTAQASWALLHGLCRLRIDGIYVDAADLDAMSDEGARILLARVRGR